MSPNRFSRILTAVLPLAFVVCLHWIANAQEAEGPAAQGAQEEQTGQRPPKPKVERIKDDTFRVGKIEFNQKTREVTFDAKVNMNIGFLEYLVVNEVYGKIHESLLTTQASPMDLNIALLLLNYKASDAIEKDKDDKAIKPQPRASFDVVVRWKESGGGDAGEKGKQKEAFIEQWIYNLATDSPASRGHWLYTGSKLDESGNFAAETDGSLIAVYRDPRAVLNNPREGKYSDEIWKPAKTGLPPKETPVNVVLRPHEPSKKTTTAKASDSKR